MDGHAFAIPALPQGWKAGSLDDAGCSTPCLDFQAYGCGCADELCAEAGVSAARDSAEIARDCPRLPSSSVSSRRPILPQAIEEAFDIEIPDEEAEKMTTPVRSSREPIAASREGQR